MLAVCLILLVAPQDAFAEAAKAATRITAKNPRASMEAVSRLSELAATSREAVQAIAAKLPSDLAFYRLAIQAELDARERLGARYPKLKRGSIDAVDQSPISVLGDLNQKYGERLDLALYTRGAAPAAGAANVTLKLEDVAFLDAVEAVCLQAKSGLIFNGAQIFFIPSQEEVSASPYRNFLVLMPSASRSRKVEFGAGETRSLRYSVMLLWDSDANVLRFEKPQVTEVIDSAGKPLAPIPDEPAPAEPEPPRKETDPIFNVVNRMNQWELAVAIPQGDKIARLRGFYPISVPGEFSAFEFTDLEKDQKKSDDHYELEIARNTEKGLTQVLIRVKPKGSMDELIKASVEILGVSEGMETPLYSPARLSEGRLEYAVSAGVAVNQFGQREPKVLNTIKVRVSRTLVSRRIPFEFVDLPAK